MWSDEAVKQHFNPVELNDAICAVVKARSGELPINRKLPLLPMGLWQNKN